MFLEEPRGLWTKIRGHVETTVKHRTSPSYKGAGNGKL